MEYRRIFSVGKFSRFIINTTSPSFIQITTKQYKLGTPYNFRSWLDQPHMDPNTNLLTEEYARGIQEFMGVVQSQPEARTSKYLLCPCSTCKNNIRVKKMEV